MCNTPVTVNVNSYVKVKLLPIGLAIHQAEHEKYCPHLPYTPPEVDADGYSEFQLHSLMNIFGAYLLLGLNIPFETDIIFAEYKTNEFSNG